jgi:hypothetical protein
MSHWLDEPRAPQDFVTIPRVWVTIVLSFLIHFAILIFWIPRTHLLTPGDEETEQEADRLQVELTAPRTPAPASPPPPASAQMQAALPPAIRPPRTAAHPLTPPLMTQRNPDAPPIVIPPPTPPAPPAVVAPTPPTPPVETDLAAYIAARKRERGESVAPSVDENAQFNRTIAANLPAAAHGVAAQDKHSGGIFQIKRMTYDDAAFEFFGWNTEMARKTPQLIEVRKGDNADMRIAVVRRMIAIVRQFEKEDFTWDSPRLGHNITQSARVSDTLALEAFLMREFFEDGRNQ